MRRISKLSIFFSVVFGLASTFIAPLIREMWPSDYISKNKEFAKAIVEGFRVERNGSLNAEKLTHQYLDHYQTPQQISESISSEIRAQPKTTPAPKVSDQLTVEQLEESYITGVLPEVEHFVVEYGTSKKMPLVIYVVISSICGAIFGLLIPIILGICWKFSLSCIRELSLAVQGK